MYSYKHFTPGRKNNTARLIKYLSDYNEKYGNGVNINNCHCIPDKYDKNTLSTNTLIAQIPNSIRKSQVINSSKGGNIQYGNFYLGKQLNINYLGKIEGMHGGSGSPPINKF